MANETATATQTQSEAKPSTEAPATLLTSVSDEPGKQTQTAETQTPPANEKPAEGSEAPAPESKPATEVAKPATGAPEKYEDFKAPEGMQFDPEVITSFSAAAKEANLTQDAAQKLVEKMAPALAQRQLDQVKAIHAEWTEQSKTDAEFGGDKFQENLAIAKKAINAFDPLPEGQKTTPLRTLLDMTGIGNHPEFLRLLIHAGKAISGDTYVGGQQRTITPAATDLLYDKTPKS